jgi:tetrathionate reductase subunit B
MSEAQFPEAPGGQDLVAASDMLPVPDGSQNRTQEAAPAVVGTDASEGGLVKLEQIAPAILEASVSRRAFLGFGLAVAGGLTGATALARLFPVFADSADAASPIVPTYDPVGKQWTFVVDTAACIGCGMCVAACKEENNVPEEPEYTRTWIERHTVTADGALYVDSPDGGINGFPPQSTAAGASGKTVTSSYFEPHLCMQCEDSPCTAVCPVGATYRTADGVILVDPRRCIGCGYCVVACPYGARYLVPAGGNAPSDTPGVADKCTWCYHRISRGAQPACVEVCPVGARKFGDASDPASEIATLVRQRGPKVLHPEYGTRPRVLYLGPSIEEA